MGCHTWFWKPTSKSKEQLKRITINYLKQQIKVYSEPSEIEHLLSCTYEDHGFTMSIQDIEKEKNYYVRWLRRIESNKSVWESSIYFFNKGEYRAGVFYEEHKYHDLFRGGWYDTPDLSSLDETFDFCSKNKIELSIDNMLSLFHFFYSYPIGGLITFG